MADSPMKDVKSSEKVLFLFRCNKNPPCSDEKETFSPLRYWTSRQM